jgi:hypothetical protein
MFSTKIQETVTQRLRTAKQLWFRIVNDKPIKFNYEMPAPLEKELKALSKKESRAQYKKKCAAFFEEKTAELRNKHQSRKDELNTLRQMEQTSSNHLDASLQRRKKHLLDLEEVGQLETNEFIALQKKEFLEHLNAIEEYFRLYSDTHLAQHDHHKAQTALLRQKWQHKKSYNHAKTLLENGHSARKAKAKIEYYQEAKNLFAALGTFSDAAYYKENARYHLAKSFVRQGDEARDLSAKSNAYRDAQEIFADLITRSQYYHKDDAVTEHRDTTLYRWGICFVKMADQAILPHHKANFYLDALERFSLIQSRAKHENLPFHEDTARLRWARCRLNTEDPEMRNNVRNQLQRLLDRSVFYKKEAQQHLESFAQQDEATRMACMSWSSKSVLAQGFFKLVSKVEMLSPTSLKKELSRECRF